MSDQFISIEYHQIDMRYRHTRMFNDAAIERIGRSIAKHGQLRPVCVIPDVAADRYILIDGYLRLEACKRRGLDTVLAVCQSDEKQALLSVLIGDQQRQLQAIEQACLLDELARRFDQSLSSLAQLVGRDKSWVHRRLALVRSLPQSLLDALSAGTVSTWAATRILAPLARANISHAASLIEYLTHHHVSTRQLNRFFDHYKCASKSVRQNIIDQPELFFKALTLLCPLNRDQEQQTRSLIKGPEGRFIDDLNAVVTSLKRLTSHVPEFLSDDNKNRINTQITSVQQLINQLHERINNDKHTTQTDNRNTLPAPDRDTGHQPSTGSVTQHGAKSVVRGP